jgi:hypothetical protein
MPIIPALGRLRKEDCEVEDCEVEDSWGYFVRPCFKKPTNRLVEWLKWWNTYSLSSSRP